MSDLDEQDRARPTVRLSRAQRAALVFAASRLGEFYTGRNPCSGNVIVNARTVAALERMGLVTTRYAWGETTATLTPKGWAASRSRAKY